MQLIGFFLCASLLLGRGDASTVAELAKNVEKLKLVMPEKGTLDNIETSLLAMVQSAEKQPAGSNTLAPFLDQITEIINSTMKKAIKDRLKTSQDELDQSFKNFSLCIHPIDYINESLAHLTDLNDVHMQCRRSEDTKMQQYQTDCRTGLQVTAQERETVCANYQSRLTIRDPADVCKMDPATRAPTIGNYLIAMEEEFDAVYSQLLDSKYQCGNLTPSQNDTDRCGLQFCNVQDKRLNCSLDQKAFEGEVCKLFKHHSCSAYQACWAAAVTEHKDALVQAQKVDAGLKVEWRSVLRIECYIKALGKPQNEVGPAIDVCKATVWSTEEIQISYPPTPPSIQLCDEDVMAPFKPGTAVFGARWYRASPVLSPSVSCASQCCMYDEFVPSYPAGVQCPYQPGGENPDPSLRSAGSGGSSSATLQNAFESFAA